MAWRQIENRGEFIREEYLTGGAITPGMLGKINTAGALVVHDIVEGRTPIIIADVNALIGDPVTTAYANAVQAMVTIPGKGSVVNVLVASGQTCVIGTNLVSGGDGTFITAENATSGVLIEGVLLEAEEATGLLAANTLVAARVL